MASAPSVKHDRPLDGPPAPPHHRRPRRRRRPGRVRLRRPLPVRDRRVRRPAAARAGAKRRPTAGPRPATATSEWPALARRGPPAARASARLTQHSSSTGRNQPHARRVHRHDRHPGRVGDQAHRRTGHRPDYTRRFARAHEDAGFDRVLIGYASVAARRHPGRRLRRRAHRAARLPGRAPARLRRADPRRPHVRHARPVQRRPDRGAHHHRRQRRRAAPRRRLPGQGRALRAHRRVPRHRQAGLDRPPAVQLRRQVLPGRGLISPASSRRRSRDQAVLRRLVRGGLPGRRQARRHVRAVGRAPGRDQAADRLGERGRGRGPRPTSPASASRFRPILGPTEELAWERAHRILDRPRRTSPLPRPVGRESWGLGGDSPENVGSQRLLAAAAKGELHDRALWTPLAAATGAGGNSTALVGTPETVAQALLDYIDIGVTTLLIRGYDPSTTPSTTAATCCRWSARRSPGATPSGRREPGRCRHDRRSGSSSWARSPTASAVPARRTSGSTGLPGRRQR